MNGAPTLAERLSSRNNAVTPLRLGAACLVVFGHAWEVSGHGFDPLHRLFGEPYSKGGVNFAGELGVNTFFALSGYLVTQSWLRSRSPADFVAKRLRRILPAFWVCLLVTGLMLFPWLWARQHHASFLDAFSSAPFFDYVWRNALVRILQPSIGDLFATHPASSVANGALWSLFPELLCYLAVALGGACLVFTRRRGLLWAGALLVFAIHLAGPWLLPQFEPSLGARLWYPWRLATQATFFAAGALWCVYGARIVIGAARSALTLSGLLVASAVHGYLIAGPLLLPYFALSIAAIFRGDRFERAGDFSYGVYLFHYPLQQTLVVFGAGTWSPWLFFLATLAFVLPLAVLSWFGVERPALRWSWRATATAPA